MLSAEFFTQHAKHYIKGTSANSVDPDQIPQYVASDQGLHCLHNIKKFLQYKLTRHPLYRKWTYPKN